MKRATAQLHARIVNDALYYIYQYLDSPITLETLAERHGLSVFHFHRIFKEQTGQTVYTTLQSIRLQKAANLLLVNRGANISQIAQQCGYGSHSAFIRAFSTRYGATPTQWRGGYYREFSRRNIDASEYARCNPRDFCTLEPSMVKMPPLHLAYMRHFGYHRGIRQVWRRLYGFALEQGLESARQFGLHHDNPSITPLEECAYVAAIEVPETFEATGSIATFTFPPSLCAVFRVEGRYGEVLGLIRHVYHGWLPDSGFEAKTLPAFAHYHRNHFLRDDERFMLDFYLPVSVI